MKANELFILSSGSVAFWEKDQLKLVGETGGVRLMESGQQLYVWPRR